MQTLEDFVHSNIDVNNQQKQTNWVMKTIVDKYQYTENTYFIEIFLYVVLDKLRKQGFINGIHIYSVLLNDNIYKIKMERARNNLENYMINTKNLHEVEKKSIVFQIFASIVEINKLFHFVHNDLHTRNVVYFETSEKFIHYNINNQLYIVPTFGKIFKIIDFGNSIVQYENINYISGAFSMIGCYKNIDISKVLDCENSCILINIIHFLRNFSIIHNDNSVFVNFIYENQGNLTYIFQNNDIDIKYLYNNIHKYSYNMNYFNCFV